MRWLAPFLFEMLCFAQTVRMEVGLCDRCRMRRIAQCRIAAVLLLSGTIALIAAKYLASIDLLGAAGAFLLAAGILFTKSIPLKIRRISDGVVYAGGAGAAYLAGLSIGGPPGIGVTSADLAIRLAQVREGRRRKRQRNRRRHRHRRRHRLSQIVMVESLPRHAPADDPDQTIAASTARFKTAAGQIETAALSQSPP
jgi:hypothetical protein